MSTTSAPAYLDATLPDSQRIADLLARMTIDEKIDCLAGAANVPRLGVRGSPHIEGYHGVAQGGPSNWGRIDPSPTTQFPQAYGLGSTWDPDLVERVAAHQAYEARYLFQHPRYRKSGLIVRAPNADIARDPRWGRTEEVYGEDPHHVSKLSLAFTKGLQGTHPRYRKCVALLKHFLANSNENQRSRSSSNFDEQLFREYYAKAFETCVREGGSPALMAAYNAVNSTPAHVHPMLRETVMKEWGLDGIICTDGGGLSLLVSDHKAFPDLATAAAACIKAGINHFLDDHADAVREAIARGLLTEAEVDVALAGVFKVSIQLGLLDPISSDPYSEIGLDGEAEPWLKPETRAFVREVTARSIVLLRNEGSLLPLDETKLRRVALVGPLADRVLLDWYSGTPPYTVSPQQALEAVSAPHPFGPAKFGIDWAADMSDTAVRLAGESDVAIVCLGNHPLGNASWEIVTSPSDGKEGVDRQDIALPVEYERFLQRVHAANPNVILALVSNFPYAMPWVVANIPAIVHLTHASQELGNGLVDVLFGHVSPGGKLAQTWPASLDQLPPMMDYDIRNGRTYMYQRSKPQFAFGFGLSYTRFALSNPRLSRDTLGPDDSLFLDVAVSNIGDRGGDEVVQLYVAFPETRASRPPLQLKAFRRIHVAAGETATCSLSISASDLRFWNSATRGWEHETGPVQLRIGAASDDLPITLGIWLTD